MNTLPNFLVVGFPKCGTTSLYEYLKIHPEIFLPSTKELHFFTYDILKKALMGPDDDRILNNGTISSFDDYLKQYLNVKNEIAIGDCSPSYASFPECIPKINNILRDNVKIVILIRNPIDRAYSNYRHLKRQGRETLPFRDALESEEKRLKNGYGDIWGYKFNSLYYDRILAFQQSFKHVKIIVFENFVNNRNEFFDLLKFLNVSPEYDEKFLLNKFNEGANYKSNLLVNMINGTNYLKSFVLKYSPFWSRKYLLKIKKGVLDLFKTSTPNLLPNDRVFLKKIFADDVVKLRSKLNIDISKWSDFN